VGDGESAKCQAVVGTFMGENFWAFGGGAGEFQGSFDCFRSGVAEEAGIARGTQFFDESFGEEAGENGAVHLNHIREVEIQDIPNSFLYRGMIAADVENAVAAEEVEVVLTVEIVQVGTFCAGIDFIKANRSLNFDERTIDVLVVEVVVLAQTSQDGVFEVEGGHEIYY